MDDLISRQAARNLPLIPEENRHYQTFNLDDAYERGWFDLLHCLAKLPSAQQWIPCSERLPENGHYYLTCSEYGHVESDYYWDGFEMAEKYGSHIAAWMPLPAPYREEKKDE